MQASHLMIYTPMISSRTTAEDLHGLYSVTLSLHATDSSDDRALMADFQRLLESTLDGHVNASGDAPGGDSKILAADDFMIRRNVTQAEHEVNEKKRISGKQRQRENKQMGEQADKRERRQADKQRQDKQTGEKASRQEREDKQTRGREGKQMGERRQADARKRRQADKREKASRREEEKASRREREGKQMRRWQEEEQNERGKRPSMRKAQTIENAGYKKNTEPNPK
ncbi:uncharacterized protein F5891DRAFT_984997 [Suillus fuscotomentosus]|uniref:Uncharacterized protein n=1 Tax=Suillus fuscotomentosus TaxID=1912939 RepID=A0AAD4HGD4_9AGAM|nr:uncharacterized protein F5891DRAFT_984997 [Suillus fuscotomentosus]KAG1894509.1 hypothetical protein F5891DRAFT_984997 [Suillus fuscotomentosus]